MNELERAVIDAAKAWATAEDRGGLKSLFDPTTTALVEATRNLLAAPESRIDVYIDCVDVYIDRDGDRWYRRGDRDEWCTNDHCDSRYCNSPLAWVRDMYGPLEPVRDDR